MAQRVALITGGARGIGRGIALSLARRGWCVAVCHRRSHEAAEETRAAIQEQGAGALALQRDVSDPEQSAALVHDVLNEWGRIDALVNAAGPYHRRPLLDETLEGWHEMFDNNLHPVFYLSRLVAPEMQRRGWGRIVNFSMVHVDQCLGQPNLTAHYIAKVGVLVLTRSLARLLAPHGITVNAIAPGFIDSGSAPADELARMTRRIPAGRLGTVQEVVAAAEFLLSDEAAYVNGAQLQIGGGWGV